MRILMLTTSYPKYSGETTAPFIEEIAAGIAARGHEVHVLAPAHPDVRRQPSERGVHLHFFAYAPHPALNVWGYAQSLFGDTLVRWQTLAVTPFALWASARAVAHTLHTQAPFDLLHAHWVLPNGVPAAVIARQHGIPLVISLHGSDIYMAERYWQTTPPAGGAFRAAAAITACSSDLLQRAVRLGAPPAHIRVIPYGVDVQAFQPNPIAAAQVRAELGLHTKTQLVVGLGRLVYKKGFGVLLDAWATVVQQHPHAHLVLVGYGDLRAALEQQSQQLGIHERVHFTGQLERERAALYLAAADLFALPIVRDQGTDGLPNVLLEAMAAARPIVASRVAGVPDVIVNGQHGLLVPDRDPPALAAAIGRVLADPEWAAQMGVAARQRVLHELTWAHTAARFEQVYNDACLTASLNQTI